MRALLAALDRQTGVLMALAALSVAAAIVSWGAWALLRRERSAGSDPAAPRDVRDQDPPAS